MEKHESILDFLECPVILANIPSKALFSFPKKGFIRIYKNFQKRSYYLELSPDKPPTKSIKINLTNDVKNTTFYPNKYKIRTMLVYNGIVEFSMSSSDTYLLTKEKYEFCIKDQDLSGEGLTIDLNKKPKEPKLNVDANEKTVTKENCTDDQVVKEKSNKPEKRMKIDVHSLCEPYVPEPPVRRPVSIKEPTVTSTSNFIELTNAPIAKSKFYSSPAPAKGITKVLDDLDTLLPVNKKTTKRDREEEGVEPVRPELFTPKRHKNRDRQYDPYDQENNENDVKNLSERSLRRWNRSNSFNQSCGKGFSNLGNTCYMNAILQCLLNIDIFAVELVSSEFYLKEMGRLKQLSDASEECLYFSLCGLLMAREQRNEALQVNWLKQVKNSISKEAFRFSGFAQQDAHEFLCQVLDQLKEDVDKFNKTTAPSMSQTINNATTSSLPDSDPLETLTSTTSKDLMLGTECITPKDLSKSLIGNQQETTLTNPIVDNFQFQVDHQITCKKCGNVLNKSEKYNNLCLELPPSETEVTGITLQETLDIFFRDEHLDDFKCEKCESLEVFIQRKLVKLPRVLILHLKRYQFQETLIENEMEAIFNDIDPNEITNEASRIKYKLVKNDAHVQIPKYLNLKSLITDEEHLQPPVPISGKTKNLIKRKQSLPSPVPTRTPLKPYNAPLRTPDSTRSSRMHQIGVLCESKKFNSLSNTPKSQIKKEKIKSKLSTDSDDLIELEQIKYDPCNFSIKDVSEEEQVKQALAMSMKTSRVLERSFEMSELLNLDGGVDIEDVLESEEEIIATTDSELDPDFVASAARNKSNLKTYGVRKQPCRKISRPEKQRSSAARNNEIGLGRQSGGHVSNEDDEMTKAIKQSMQTFESEKLANSMLSNLSKDIQECPTKSPPTSQETIELKPMDETIYKETNSYRILGIVNHLGMTSSSGHYISDVYDTGKSTWSSYDDKRVARLTEDEVLTKRARTGYIFFYIHKSMEIIT